MPIVSVRIPQMGEGLQEVLLVDLLKKPGDRVKRDEPIYTMETDKAVTEVESPYDGRLVSWSAKPAAVLPIGTEIAKMEVAEGVKEMSAGHGPAHGVATNGADAEAALAEPQQAAEAAGPLSNRQMPPRTRRYLLQHGLLEQAHLIPAKSGKLMPEDVDAYLAAKQSGAAADRPAAASANPSSKAAPVRRPPAGKPDAFAEIELPKSQQTLNYRLARGAQVCVPVTIMAEVDWTAIDAAHARLKAARAPSAQPHKPSAFTQMLWCVVRAMEKFPKFRSTLSAEGTKLRTYEAVNLGIAVALPDDILVTAGVSGADRLSWPEFAEAVREQIARARQGQDQATAATTLSVSNMGSVGVRIGIPAVVAPAVATMVLGETHWQPVARMGSFQFKKVAMLSLSFDHRVINGAGGSDFLNEVKQRIESFELPEIP